MNLILKAYFHNLCMRLPISFQKDFFGELPGKKKLAIFSMMVRQC